jgi:S-adenosylmethionine-diacylglycerol 3-amino-3-carboxypropyl transferase
MKSSSVFDDVVFSQCWEDVEIDRTAFRIKRGDTVFTITSGGCNALAFLADDPERVLAVDLNATQNHLTELKKAAYAGLDHGDLLEMLGVRPCRRRAEMYQAVRSRLSEPAARYWDQQPGKIEQGIIHSGRYERYLAGLRACAHAVMGRRLIEAFFAEDDPERRAALFAARWDGLRWKLITQGLASRRVLTRVLDASFFRYVEGDFSFGQHFADRTKLAMTLLPPRENPYLSYIMLGRYYSEDHLPTYLLAKNHATIKGNLARLSVQTASCEEYLRALPDSTVNHFNFSNIFEWVAPDVHEAWLRETHRVGTPGAILAYRNTFVHRERPPSLAALFAPRRDLAMDLLKRDRSFIFRNYVVEELTK